MSKQPRHLDAGRLQRRVLAAKLYHHAGHASPSAPPRLPVRPLGEYVPRPLMRPTCTSDPGSRQVHTRLQAGPMTAAWGCCSAPSRSMS